MNRTDPRIPHIHHPYAIKLCVLAVRNAALGCHDAQTFYASLHNLPTLLNPRHGRLRPLIEPRIEVIGQRHVERYRIACDRSDTAHDLQIFSDPVLVAVGALQPVHAHEFHPGRRRRLHQQQRIADMDSSSVCNVNHHRPRGHIAIGQRGRSAQCLLFQLPSDGNGEVRLAGHLDRRAALRVPPSAAQHHAGRLNLQRLRAVEDARCQLHCTAESAQ